ncbi:YceD family protein [Rhodopila sp.]|uniref:YceD family protein n=1 Tax=Rhodopila sp. TaxID=2480087 RepID=UPI003D1452FF
MKPELHRPLSLDHIGPRGLDLTVEANPAECSALAIRMNIAAVLALSCAFHLIRQGRDVVLARGTLRARVTQTCVISLEDFDAPVQETFQVRFVPSEQQSDEIDPEADDEIPFEGNQIDLGELAAEQLGLALDPYPRMPGVEIPAAEDDPEPHPFAALRRLN